MFSSDEVSFAKLSCEVIVDTCGGTGKNPEGHGVSEYRIHEETCVCGN